MLTITASRTGALLAAALFALNPNVLYLQSTPMTEPMLFALSALVVLHLAQWVMSTGCTSARRPVTIVTACLTRYEAWPIVGAAMAIAALAKWLRGGAIADVVREIGWLAIYPALTVIFFLGLSFASTGQWFVTGGFYVPDPELQGQLPLVWEEIRKGLVGLAGQRFVSALSIALGVIALATHFAMISASDASSTGTIVTPGKPRLPLWATQRTRPIVPPRPISTSAQAHSLLASRRCLLVASGPW